MPTETVTSPDYDGYMSKVLPDAANESNATLKIGENVDKTDETFRAYLEFDLDAIPAVVKVVKATLTVNVTAYSAASNTNCGLYRIKRAPNKPTWNEYDSVSSNPPAYDWTTGGAGDSTNDHDATTKQSFTGPSATGSLSVSGDDLADQVQHAITNDVASARRVRMMVWHDNDDDDTGDTEWTIDSSDAGGGDPPELAVVYRRRMGLVDLPWWFRWSVAGFAWLHYRKRVLVVSSGAGSKVLFHGSLRKFKKWFSLRS